MDSAMKCLFLSLLLLFSVIGNAQQNKNAFEFESAITSDFASNISGGVNQSSAYLGNIDLALTFDTEKAKLWKGGTAFIYVLNNHGRSISDIVGDFQGVDNIEALPNTRLYQFWYRQKIGNVSLTFGQHDLNSEFANTNYGSTFINSSFGIQPDISANVSASIFPLATLGAVLKWEYRNLAFLTAIYDGDPGNQITNPHSLHFRLNKSEGSMNLFEFQYKFEKDSFQKGNIKFGIWHHTANVKSIDTKKEYRNNQGVYFLADYQIFSEKKDNNQGLGAFIQLGMAPKKCNFVKSYIGGGLVYHGLFPKRDKDKLGIAFGYAVLHNNLIKHTSHEYSTSETVIEFTYKSTINSYFSIQPNLQYIINPSGLNTIKNAFICSIRLKLEY